jgi:hypothetical protein
VKLRDLVGVRKGEIRITLAENAVLKSKQEEVRSRQYVYRATLLKRGWTEQLIDSVLGEPDKLVPNPHYRSGPRAMLCRVDRVEAAENKRATPGSAL